MAELRADHSIAVTRAANREIADMEANDEIVLRMRAAGYQLMSEMCPASVRTPDRETLLEKARHGGANQKDEDAFNLAVGRLLTAYDEQQALEPSCYAPLAWGDRQIRRFERLLGLAPSN
jgi:hypothetical protein